ncbi:MAG: phosphoribosylformylglycinamidine synthase subunit PurQ [Chloroflexota bacterium]|nr:phosphoribosylformylglycinamidine synthase subunit PurQ [Chloroflexota bacterium]
MKVGVVTFPGSNGDTDCIETLKLVEGCEPQLIWHKSTDLMGADALILPGGFAHGDYLRPGSIAQFSPVMREVARFAASGGPVLGICNGFQVLTEAGLLPGALLRNQYILFHCAWTHVRVSSNRSPWLEGVEEGTVLRMAVAHGQGNYFADTETRRRLVEQGQVAFEYCDPEGNTSGESNHNGSVDSIAGVTNEAGNILGMMPHPERSSDPLLGSADGRVLFESLVRSMAAGAVGR